MPPAPPPTPPSASLLATPSALDACLTVADARAADLGPASGPGVYAYVVLSLPPTAEPPVDLLASDVGTIPDVCAYLSDPAQVRFVLLRDQHALLLVQFLGAHVAGVRRARSLAQARTLARDFAPFRQAAATVLLSKPTDLTPTVVHTALTAKTKGAATAAPATSSSSASTLGPRSGPAPSGAAASGASAVAGIAALRARFAALDTAAPALSTDPSANPNQVPSPLPSPAAAAARSRRQTASPPQSPQWPRSHPLPPVRSVSAMASVPSSSMPSASTSTSSAVPLSRAASSSNGESSRRTMSSVSTVPSPVSPTASPDLCPPVAPPAAAPRSRSPTHLDPSRLDSRLDSRPSSTAGLADGPDEDDEEINDQDDPVLIALRGDSKSRKRVVLARARLLRSQQHAALQLARAKNECDRLAEQINEARHTLSTATVRAEVLAERWTEQRPARSRLDAFERSQVEAAESERAAQRARAIASQTRALDALEREYASWAERAQEVRDEAGKRMRSHTTWEHMVVSEFQSAQQAQAARAEREGLKAWAQTVAQHRLAEAEDVVVLASAHSAFGAQLGSCPYATGPDAALLIACIGVQKGETGYLKRRTCLIHRPRAPHHGSIEIYSSDPSVGLGTTAAPKPPLWSIAAADVAAVQDAESDLMLDHAVALVDFNSHALVVMVADSDQEKVALAAALSTATGRELRS